MRILHVNPETGWGGGERQVELLVRNLAGAGHANLLAAPLTGRLVARLRGAAEVVDLSIRNDLDVRAGWRLRRTIRKWRPDIVHFHTGRAHAMCPWVPRRIPSVVTRRMDYPVRSSLRNRFLYNRWTKKVVAISSDVERRLIEGGVEPARIVRIPSSIAPRGEAPTRVERRAAREGLGVGPDDFVLAAVGVLERRKGHDVLFRALARKTADDAILLLVGDGGEKGRLESLARDLGLGDRVRLLGRLDDPSPVLLAADVFVHPSRAEGLGVALLEAMDFELPIVASDVGGIPDVVVSGETGELVPPGDESALARAIDVLRDDPDVRGRLGRAGRARLLGRFEASEMGAAYERLYREIGNYHPGVRSADPLARGPGGG